MEPSLLLLQLDVLSRHIIQSEVMRKLASYLGHGPHKIFKCLHFAYWMVNKTVTWHLGHCSTSIFPNKANT